MFGNVEVNNKKKTSLSHQRRLSWESNDNPSVDKIFTNRLSNEGSIQRI